MAKVWFSVIVLIIAKNAFASTCPESRDILSCDQCVRCGGSWCSQEKVNMRCSYTEEDTWCSSPETTLTLRPVEVAGKDVSVNYVERTIMVDQADQLEFAYTATEERNVSHAIYNTTMPNPSSIEVSMSEPTCNGISCKLYLNVKADHGFCSASSTDMEFIYVSLKVDGLAEEALIKYHIACACECSKKTLRKAPQCSGNGDLTCGACYCYPGWKGESCESADCPDRGDVPSTCHDLGCSGNGHCGPCGNCVCDATREGSQYFDPRNLCADICMDASEREDTCGPCLTTGRYGECATPVDKSECRPRVTLKYNETIAAEKDLFHRKIWIGCNETLKLENGQACYVEYLASRDERDMLRMMIVKSCNDRESQMIAVGATETKVPIILGVLGLIATVAAVGGILAWKHFNSVPPMPFASPDYQNIDAEDCVGENPLYKSPTSTFTNPQFGKC